jgi:uncharacterized OB-fold protein
MTTTESTKSHETLIHDVHWEIDYKVKLGRAWTRFMRGLENEELWGTKCEACQRVYIPAQDYCEACYERIQEWVQVEPVGTLKTATIVYQGFEGGPKAPYAVGAIEIDGTDSMLMHFIGGVDLNDPDKARAALHSGLRVRARWSSERSAAITDISHFAPVDGE